jgi:uncharacterized glyoxalase superfamily protein PhnB
MMIAFYERCLSTNSIGMMQSEEEEDEEEERT